MKVGGEYELAHIGLRQWQKFAREVRVDTDEMIELLISMANRLPDEVNAVRLRAREQGLTNAIVERLATQLTAQASNCGRLLGVA